MGPERDRVHQKRWHPVYLECCGSSHGLLVGRLPVIFRYCHSSNPLHCPVVLLFHVQCCCCASRCPCMSLSKKNKEANSEFKLCNTSLVQKPRGMLERWNKSITMYWNRQLFIYAKFSPVPSKTTFQICVSCSYFSAVTNYKCVRLDDVHISVTSFPQSRLRLNVLPCFAKILKFSPVLNLSALHRCGRTSYMKVKTQSISSPFRWSVVEQHASEVTFSERAFCHNLSCRHGSVPPRLEGHHHLSYPVPALHPGFTGPAGANPALCAALLLQVWGA